MKEYKALKALSKSFRLLGWISFVLTIIFSCAAFFVPISFSDDALVMGILGTLSFFAGPLVFISGLAFSSGMFLAGGILELLIDISDYTYQTRELMRRALTRSTKSTSA